PGWRPDATGRVTVDGTWPRLAAAARVDFGAAGRIAVDGDVDLGGVPRYAATARLTAVDASAMIAGSVATHATGRVRVRGHGPHVAYHAARAPSAIAGQALTPSWLAGTTSAGVTHVHGVVATTAGNVRLHARLARGTPAVYRADATVDVARLDALAAGVSGTI